MGEAVVKVYKLPSRKVKEEFLKRHFNSRRITATAMAFFFLASVGAITSIAVDNNSDGIDDNLTVSLGAPGTTVFGDTGAGLTSTVASVSFSGSAANYVANNTISATNLNNNSSTNIGTGSGGLALGSTNVFGGAEGSTNYAAPGNSSDPYQINFSAQQRYVGFWWSAGNSDNNVQLLDASGNTLLSPAFTTSELLQSIFAGVTPAACPSTRPTTAQVTNNPNLRYCGNPKTTSGSLDDPDNAVFVYNYVAEPFAYVHLRYSEAFSGVRLWGTGFEFDNLTISQTVPAASDDEGGVGADANDSCDGAGRLENGGFESGTSNWSTTATDSAIEVWASLSANANDTAISGPGDASSHGGGAIVELQANPGGGANQGIYQDIPTIPGTTITYSFWHHARSGGGSNSNQEVTVRIGAVPNPDPAAGGWTSTEQNNARNSFGVQGVTSSVSISQAWTQASSTYTVPEGQTTTRFLFASLANGGSDSYGNLLDDIEFIPTLACPDETSINFSRDPLVYNPTANDFFPTGTTSVSVISIVGDSATATANGTNLRLSSTSTDSFTVRYRLTSSSSGISEARVVVNVMPEVITQAPAVKVYDPRLTFADLPALRMTGPANALICFDESNRAGETLTGTSFLRTDLLTKNSDNSGNNGFGSATITNDRSALVSANHSLTNALATINSSSGARIYWNTSTSSSRYLRIRTLPLATPTSVGVCADALASSTVVIEFRPLLLTQTIRSGTVEGNKRTK